MDLCVGVVWFSVGCWSSQDEQMEKRNLRVSALAEGLAAIGLVLAIITVISPYWGRFSNEGSPNSGGTFLFSLFNHFLPVWTFFFRLWHVVFVCQKGPTTPRPVLLLSTLFYSLAHEKCFFKERKEWNHTGIIGAVGSNGLQLLKKEPRESRERERKELRGKWGQKCCLPSPEEEKTVEVLWYLLKSCSPSTSSTFWDIFLPCSLTTGHMITQDSFSFPSLFRFSFYLRHLFLNFSQPERQTRTVCWLVCRPR